ncbi:MAG: DNA cytosine methyltransferase [Planctomycetes bacterium]|nr:DNA cytosine methyltransferase [Planctomycetota bacterium]
MRKRRSADLFAGAGGWSAGARLSGAVDVTFGLNHWLPAVQTFSANFPDAKVVNCKIETCSPSECGPIDELVASPSCRQHSNGRSDRPIEEQDRAHAWDVVRWLDWHRPEFLKVENVPQFVKWGPCDDEGHAIESERGAFFELWLQAIKLSGYAVEWHKLNAMDFGARTDRERFVLMARKGKRGPVFPEPTHGPGRLPYLSVADCLDLGSPGRPMAGRIKPKTLARVEHGRKRFGDGPFLVKYFGTGISASIDEPLSTLTTKHRHGLVIGDTLRVLTNEEMRKAQGFPDGYIFCGRSDEVTKQIGNSVPPPLSRACCLSVC